MRSNPVRKPRSSGWGKLLLLALPMVLGAPALFAQEQPDAAFNVEVPKDMIILASTTDYKAAAALAKDAAVRLRRKLDLRGLKPLPEIGLSMSRKECAEIGYPCYWARGDGNAANDDYISVEYSNAYKGFAKGYYIVVAAITDVQSDGMKTRLAAVRKAYPGAYAKRTYIWRGCMH